MNKNEPLCCSREVFILKNQSDPVLDYRFACFFEHFNHVTCVFQEYQHDIPPAFYFPILYGTYYYRKSGILIGGTCAVAFQTIAYYYLYPDITSLGFATAQAILFVCVSVIVAYFLDMMDTIEQRYKSIFWDSRFGVVLFDPYTFKISLANKQMEYMLGYSSTELVNMTYTQLFQSREEQNRFFERLGSGEDTVDFETRFVTKNHEPLWVSLSWNRVDPHIISCLVIDIDSRKHTIAAADDRLVQYEQITEISPLGIVILQNNVITYANRAFCAFSEYNADFIVGKKFITLIYPDRPGKIHGIRHQAADKDTAS